MPGWILKCYVFCTLKIMQKKDKFISTHFLQESCGSARQRERRFLWCARHNHINTAINNNDNGNATTTAISPPPPPTTTTTRLPPSTTTVTKPTTTKTDDTKEFSLVRNSTAINSNDNDGVEERCRQWYSRAVTTTTAMNSNSNSDNNNNKTDKQTNKKQL